jgi:hypothetical protein
MEMSLSFVAAETSSYARKRLDPAVMCGDVTKDKDCGESCDPLSPEHEPEPRLDGPDESARFIPLNNFFIMHNTCNNNTHEVPNTLGVSVSRTGGRKQKVV